MLLPEGLAVDNPRPAEYPLRALGWQAMGVAGGAMQRRERVLGLTSFLGLFLLLGASCAVRQEGFVTAPEPDVAPAMAEPVTEESTDFQSPNLGGAEPGMPAVSPRVREANHEIAAVGTQRAAAPNLDSGDKEPAGASANGGRGVDASLTPMREADAEVALRTGLGLATPASGSAAHMNTQLAEARRRIDRLEHELASERKRRREVEAEMSRLLHETSAGPFEHGADVVETHLREQLDRARREIRDLRAALARERREREDLRQKYASLEAKMELAQPAAAAANAELEALQERQQKVLASIRQDLEASQQREAGLRDALDAAHGVDGVPLAEAVTSLRSENAALQLRLDEEHQHNRDLTAKLQLATRVTDLIFKMQTGGSQRAAPMPRAAR